MDRSSGCRRVRMLPPPVRLLCLWLCGEAVAAQLLWPGTKATFTPRYESAAAAPGNAQSRGWRTVSGEDNGETRGASARASWVGTASPNSRFVRKSSARPESVGIRQGGKGDALRTGKTDTERPSGGGCSLDELLRQSPHGSTCRRTRRLEWRSRTRRSGPTGTGGASDAVPVAMAQEQEAEPPLGLNSSDYEEEEYSLPDLPDTTPPERPRRKQLRNPFYPLTAESYGAYAVVVTAAFIFSAGVIGNVSVMCIVCHNYYMRSISNSLLANLALWDFIIIFFCLPLVVFHELTRNWLLGEFSCRIIPYLEVASLGVTTFTLCALCIDRFRAATNVQLYYEMIENWASTSAKLAVIWVGALLLALPELLIRQLVTEDGEPPGVTPCERCVIRISTELPDTLYVLGLTYDSARLWWYFGCYFCLPTLFTICSSLATARRIRRAERASVRGTKKQIQLESQMNCAVVALAILYGFCIIPENICNIIVTYMAAGVPRRTLDALQVASQLLLFCKSAATPALLFCLCRPFTRAFLDCCCCCCSECGPPRSPAADLDEDAADLELSAFSTARREPSISPAYTAVGTHC